MSSEEELRSGSEPEQEESEQSEVEADSGSEDDEQIANEDEQTPADEEVPDKFSREAELMETLFGNKEQLIERLKDNDRSSKVIQSDDKSAAKRKAVWEDSDDEQVKVEDGMKSSRVRNYLQDPDRKYKQHLSQKFQKIVGEPKWAQLDRDASDSDSDNEALKHVGHVLGPAQGALMRNTLDYRRRRDLNKTTSNEGPTINVVEFHPNSCVALVAGTSGVASLFSVEPRNCDKLHSICFKNFSVTCGRFSKGGEEAVFGGNKNNYLYTFDLLAGQTRKTHLPRSEMTNAGKFEISPDGKIMAVAGRFGDIHLLHARTKEWITSMKQEHKCSALTFSTDSSRLFTHSTDNEVNIFDLRNYRTSHRFIDDGCIVGKTIAMSPNGKLLATGSAEGIVNVYEADSVMNVKYPQPIKVISNLATSISMTRFNSTSEILGLCSRDSMEGIKLAHFPSGSVFANFPLNTRSLGNPTCMAFSPGGRYMAVGTVLHRVPLYELKHYGYF